MTMFFVRAVQALEKARIDQVEEIQQSDPGDARQKVDPADNQTEPIGLTRSNSGHA
ncbi:MAG: hypothetical protein QM771_07375 [Nitrospira sp.]